MNIPGYLIFSTIESFSLHCFMFYFFRFGVRGHVINMVIASALFSIMSYFIRIGLDLTLIFPVTAIILYAFSVYAIVKAPPLWALFIASICYVVIFIVQTLILIIMDSTGLITFQSVVTYQIDGYILQTVTAVIVIAIGYILYRRGLGFSFSFQRFRWKSENALMIGAMLLWYILVTVLFIMKSLFYGILTGTVILLFLLYLAIRKERSEA